MSPKNSIFAELLLKWHSVENSRVLPWKAEHDIYKVWLSEVLLQQTRAETVIPYYLKFIKKYPTVKKLAMADPTEVFAMWQGLGYYNRCRNLLHTAREIALERKGIFPRTYQELLKLKGLGPYSAAAIASFAYNENVAVVDGNVYRILSRVWNLSIPIDTHEGKKYFTSLANSLLPAGHAASFNQAMMDLGAQICTPKKPQCHICPVSKICQGYKNESHLDLPIKAKKIIIEDRYLDYLVYANRKYIYLHQRKDNDIWPMLWQPFLLKDSKKKLSEIKGRKLIFSCTQRLTHLQLHLRFFLEKDVSVPTHLKKITWDKINSVALPKSIKALTDYLMKNRDILS